MGAFSVKENVLPRPGGLVIGSGLAVVLVSSGLLVFVLPRGRGSSWSARSR